MTRGPRSSAQEVDPPEGGGRRGRLRSYRATDAPGRQLTVEMKRSLFAFHGRRYLRGRPGEIQPYHITLKVSGSWTQQRKLDLKYFVETRYESQHRRALEWEPGLEQSPKAPSARPQDRTLIRDIRLLDAVEEQHPVLITLLEGELLWGRLQGFNAHELHLEADAGYPLVVMRHAIHSFRRQEKDQP